MAVRGNWVTMLFDGLVAMVDRRPRACPAGCLAGSLSRSARFVTSENLAGEALLQADEAQKALEGHLLNGLWRGPVELAGDVKPLGVGVDPKLDRGVEFGRIGFCDCIHRLSGWAFHPSPDNPMPSCNQ